MSKILLCSALGLSGVLMTLVAQGCSSSNTSNPSNDAGTDTGTTQVTDSGIDGDRGYGNHGADRPSGGTVDTGTVNNDAGALVPSNIPAGALTGLTPVAVDVGSSALNNCTANTTNGMFSCNTSTQPTVAGTPITQSDGSHAYVWVFSSLTVEAGAELDVSGGLARHSVRDGRREYRGHRNHDGRPKQEGTSSGAANT